MQQQHRHSFSRIRQFLSQILALASLFRMHIHEDEVSVQPSAFPQKEKARHVSPVQTISVCGEVVVATQKPTHTW